MHKCWVINTSSYEDLFFAHCVLGPIPFLPLNPLGFVRSGRFSGITLETKGLKKLPIIQCVNQPCNCERDKCNSTLM